MTTLFAIYFFVLGTLLGSFFNVVGYRLPRNQSIVKPRSHCPNCNHVLTPLELIPILSFLIQGGRCKNCNQKISWFYTIFEFITGSLFALSFLLFGFSIQLVLVLLFISMSVIVFISDYQTMIIPDQVLIFFTIAFLVILFFKGGVSSTLFAVLNGFISFSIMFLIKKIGDFLFKRESMGGGDIKLMGVIGLVLGYQLSIVSIFLGSIIGLPVSIMILKLKRTNIVPFGPFLCIGALILLLLNVDFNGLLAIIY
ncbi:MAG: prepilin peptidase [Bacilli bacterium]|nr:prepilin peptidase [Bacilli bacterium]